MHLHRIEAKLDAQLEKDRKKPSRVSRSTDGSILVRPSGTAEGLALAIEFQHDIPAETAMAHAFERMNDRKET